jgi:prepilin-type N-terminal cleavage/methylation domain-containing protein
MSTIHSRSRGRAGMTLIEILVVIAIIAILIALLLGGVMAVWGRGYETQDRADITNLEVALQNFYAKYKFYPPNQLKLHSDFNQFGNTQLDIQSLYFIARMWPNLGQFKGVQWAGKGTVIPAAGFVLEGDQVLVFALGGPPQGPIALPMAASSVNQTSVPALMGGFSTNPGDPIDINHVLKDRIKYFDFNKGRLFFRENDSPFPSYRNAYPEPGSGKPLSPFVYFSCNNTPNGYDTVNYVSGVAPVNKFYGVSPYIVPGAANVPVTYYKANSFQIISPGQNGEFGPGGSWPPIPAASMKMGSDDLSNFSGAQLGAYVVN